MLIAHKIQEIEEHKEMHMHSQLIWAQNTFGNSELPKIYYLDLLPPTTIFPHLSRYVGTFYKNWMPDTKIAPIHS